MAPLRITHAHLLGQAKVLPQARGSPEPAESRAASQSGGPSRTHQAIAQGRARH
jgi:hypothetical protein